MHRSLSLPCTTEICTFPLELFSSPSFRNLLNHHVKNKMVGTEIFISARKRVIIMVFFLWTLNYGCSQSLICWNSVFSETQYSHNSIACLQKVLTDPKIENAVYEWCERIIVVSRSLYERVCEWMNVTIKKGKAPCQYGPCCPSTMSELFIE